MDTMMAKMEFEDCEWEEERGPRGKGLPEPPARDSQNPPLPWDITPCSLAALALFTPQP